MIIGGTKEMYWQINTKEKKKKKSRGEGKREIPSVAEAQKSGVFFFPSFFASFFFQNNNRDL